MYLNKTKNIILYVIISLGIAASCDYLYSVYNSYYTYYPTKSNLTYPIMFFLMLSLVSKFRVRIIIISVLSAITMFQFFYFQFFGNILPPISFIQFFQNTGEVFESFAPLIPQFVFPFLIVIFLFVSLFYINKLFHDKLFHFKFSSYLLPAGLIIHLIIIFSVLNNSKGRLNNAQSRLIYPRPNRLAFENYIRTTNYFLVGILPKKINGSYDELRSLSEPEKIIDKPNRNIVLVIGESLRSDRLSLLGYDRKTTPRLDSLAENRIISSRNIFPGGTMTNTSFAVLMNRLISPEYNAQIIDQKNNLFRLAKENGFSTHFISRNSFSQLETMHSLLSRQNIDTFCSKSNMTDFLKEPEDYDIDLVGLLKNIDLNSSNFIILQQRRSHSPCFKQYPEYFGTFEDEYDNTVLYTDLVLSKMIDHLSKNSPLETFFIFTSDHGELLGENGRNSHGCFEDGVINVPFVFYTNSEADSIKTVSNNIRCHFDVSSFIGFLLGYNTKIPDDPERDIYINGTDIDGFAGYLYIKTKNDTIVEQHELKL
ncbi:MAG: sulfatase-like hydrolase/transferase [Candidatus Delongbacteria bacterium]|nr:sulfatase-like hydrolase/transferase [Candidatus Delongbacteria bacterium]